MESTYLVKIIKAIREINSRHAKKLENMLSGMSTQYYQEADAFYKKYELFAAGTGKTLEFGINSYLKMIKDMMYEYLQFARTGEYTCKSFEDANERVYNNPEVMEYYMHGLLFSQFLWKHHHAVLSFFSDKLNKHSKNCSSYLEIGGGHGLYLLEAMKIIGDDKSSFHMVDISESSLNMAKTFVANAAVEYTLQDIYKFEPQNKFDFITMGEVLEHVEKPKDLLIRLGELINEDGTIFITTPTNAPAIDHIYLFRNEQEIEDLIIESGFEIIDKVSVYSEDVSREVGEKRNIALLYGAFIKKIN